MIISFKQRDQSFLLNLLRIEVSLQGGKTFCFSSYSSSLILNGVGPSSSGMSGICQYKDRSCLSSIYDRRSGRTILHVESIIATLVKKVRLLEERNSNDYLKKR
jgi:hypothetical protein